MDKHIEVKSTPAANWRQEGKTDPHNTRYECQRVDLTMGQLTDDEIANAVFLCDHRTSFDSIVYLTAAKDRIRWLSRSNEALIAQLEAAQKERDDLLNQEFQQRLANAEHQLYMKDLAIHNIKASRKAQFRKRLVAEAALSAANEMVPVTIDSGVIRDANRYRFLRDEDAWGEDSNSWDVETRTGLISSENLMELRLDNFDAAIDARMAASDIPFLNPANASQKPVVLPRVAAIHAALTDVARHRTSVENIRDVVEAIKAAGGKVEGE